MESVLADHLGLQALLSTHTMASAPELVIDEGGGIVRCVACGHRCVVGVGRTGVCRVRFNRSGELRVPAGYVAGLQIDPIEKKPFFHALPGSDVLSFGMLGCDYHCGYCQNWVTSQALRDEHAVSRPRFCDAAALADLAVEHDVPVMVSTYNEPLITSDWAVAVFREARDRGVVCGFVSNGNATPEVLEYIRPWVDLYKVDLKGFDDRNYRSLGGTLAAVLSTIRRLHAMAFWTEIVTLVVPGFNDSREEFTQIAEFIASVSVDIPWHVTAFHPDYKMTTPGRTPAETLALAGEIGDAAGLRFVYAGNLPGNVCGREHTYCPRCRSTLIRRVGFQVTSNRVIGGKCPDCGAAIPGVWGDSRTNRRSGTGMPRAIDLP